MRTRVLTGALALLLALVTIGGWATASAQPGQPGGKGTPALMTTAVPGEVQSAISTPVVPEQDSNPDGQPQRGDEQEQLANNVPSAITNAKLLSRVQLVYRSGYVCVYDASIRPYSWAWASVTEVTSLYTPFIGAATMRVNNVVPRYGSACAYVSIDWPYTLRVRTDFLVHPTGA